MRKIIDGKEMVVVEVGHDAGFFSCCTVLLVNIRAAFQLEKRLPHIVDSSRCFSLYKPIGEPERDITYDFFEKKEDFPIEYSEFSAYNWDIAHWDYSLLNYKNLPPFIKKYFSPSEEIKNITSDLEDKYSLNYNNLCVVYYRGSDKKNELSAIPYEKTIAQALKIKELYPNIQFLIQSDDTNFIKKAKKELTDWIYFSDENRHTHETADHHGTHHLFRGTNYENAKYFLATVIIMSRCKQVITNTCNVALWIALYRGNTTNLQQYGQKGSKSFGPLLDPVWINEPSY